MKKIILIIFLIVLVAIFATSSYKRYSVKRLFASGQETFIPTFREIPIDFVHKPSVPTDGFAGGAIIDIDGDGIQEVFVSGAKGQSDALFRYENGEFKNIIAGTGLSNVEEWGYGALSIDVDNDDDTDLFVARDSGVYLYTNQDQVFSERKIELPLEENTVPIAIAAADINHDGFVDLYISTFINAANFKGKTFNDPSIVSANVMLMNNGDNTFRDVTVSSGLEFRQNTFLASFVDLDNDGWMDLVLSPNTDRVRIYKNLRDSTFEEIPPPTDYGFWMSVAIGDIDNDGDMDLFLTNVGNKIPSEFFQGDLRDDQKLNVQWSLLRNDGNFTFTDVINEKGLNRNEFSWGAIFEDFNLDGLQDLMVAENAIKISLHKYLKNPGRFFVQTQDHTFVSTEKISGVVNKHYGESQLIADFNRDGYPDIIYVNLEGPLRAFINDGGDNNFVTVTLKDNAESLGARVIVEKMDGTKLTKQVVTSTGFLSDQTPELFFGLGLDTAITSIEVIWPSGRTKTIGNVEVNSRITVD